MDVQNIRSIDGEDRRLKLFHQNRQTLKCPRCDSLDTKFCYYNNYNFSQPRHFCKSCRRYWTIGGILRNVPVGGGSRKSKNSKVKHALVRTSPSSNSHAVGNSPSPIADNDTGLTTYAPSALPSSTVINSLSVDESQVLFVAETATSDLKTATLATEDSDLGISSKMGSFANLATSSNERLPFVFSYIEGATPLKLIQVADYYEWSQNQGELQALQPRKVVEKDGDDGRKGSWSGLPILQGREAWDLDLDRRICKE